MFNSISDWFQDTIYYSKNKRLILIVFGAAVIILIVFYIWSVNRLATFGPQIITLQETKYSLQMENEILENQIAELGSLENIEKKAKEYGFEKMKNLEYIRPE